MAQDFSHMGLFIWVDAKQAVLHGRTSAGWQKIPMEKPLAERFNAGQLAILSQMVAYNNAKERIEVVGYAGVTLPKCGEATVGSLQVAVAAQVTHLAMMKACPELRLMHEEAQADLEARRASMNERRSLLDAFDHVGKGHTD